MFVNIRSMIDTLTQEGPASLALDAGILIRYARFHGPVDQDRLAALRRELGKKDRSGMPIPAWILIAPEKGGGAADPRRFFDDLKNTDDADIFARQLSRIDFKGMSLDRTAAQRLARGKDRYARVLFLIELLGYANNKGEPLFDLSRALVVTHSLEEANRQRMPGHVAWFLQQTILDEEQFFVLLACRKFNQARGMIDELLMEGWAPASSDGLRLMAYVAQLSSFGDDPWQAIKARLKNRDAAVDVPAGLSVDPGPDGRRVDAGDFLTDLEDAGSGAVVSQLLRLKFRGRDLDRNELEKIAREPDWHPRVLFLVGLLGYENTAGQALFSIHEAAVLARTLRWFAREQALVRIQWLLAQDVFNGHDIYAILQQQLFVKIELIMGRLKAFGKDVPALDGDIVIRYARLTGTVDEGRIQDLRAALERHAVLESQRAAEKQQALEKKKLLADQRALEKQKAIEERKAPLRSILAQAPVGLEAVIINPDNGVPQDFLRTLKSVSGDAQAFARQFARIRSGTKKIADIQDAVALVMPASRYARTLFLIELLRRKDSGGQQLFGLDEAVMLSAKFSTAEMNDAPARLDLLCGQEIFDGHDIYRIFAEGVFEEVQWLVKKLTQDKAGEYVWKQAELDGKLVLAYALRQGMLLTAMARQIDEELWKKKKDRL